MVLLERTYYWPWMFDDIELYVKTCLVCQQDKIEQQRPASLLDPLPIPERPWESISMDFIIRLPRVNGFGNIMVVFDRFTKYGVFNAMPANFDARDAAQLFFKDVVKYWGIPCSIISDRDTQFVGNFWMELFKIMRNKLNFSTSFHPQIDGQTECVNALLELYLRHYVTANQRNWVNLLDIAQFSYNLQKSESTGASPFELATGQQPLAPYDVAAPYKGKSPGAFRFQSMEREVGASEGIFGKGSKEDEKMG